MVASVAQNGERTRTKAMTAVAEVLTSTSTIDTPKRRAPALAEPIAGVRRLRRATRALVRVKSAEDAEKARPIRPAEKPWARS